jgi:formate hydrogenlyase subunit 6/NADH:ubiquinone oxidoreductase subunit I
MGILDIVVRNTRRSPRTRRPTDEVNRPPDLRGSLRHDANRCVGCKTCEYVCVTGGVKVNEEGQDESEWRYSPGQCTFCGRCVEFCPTQAMSFEQKPVPVSTNQAAEVAHPVPRQSCARCGQPIKQVPEPLLERLYGKPLPDNVIELRGYCQRCRARIFGERLKAAVIGPQHD